MKLKTAVQVSVDLLMTLALLVLMGYHLWGDVLHEWWGGRGCCCSSLRTIF